MSEIPTSPVPCQASMSEHTLSLADREIRYRAIAKWQTLFDQQKPIADMFYVAYLAETEAESRPLTLVFNGGPGAAQNCSFNRTEPSPGFGQNNFIGHPPVLHLFNSS